MWHLTPSPAPTRSGGPGRSAAGEYCTGARGFGPLRSAGDEPRCIGNPRFQQQLSFQRDYVDRIRQPLRSCLLTESQSHTLLLPSSPTSSSAAAEDNTSSSSSHRPVPMTLGDGNTATMSALSRSQLKGSRVTRLLGRLYPQNPSTVCVPLLTMRQ